MKLSIIIPARNEQDYLAKTLTAAFEAIDKTNFNVEVIVVDNQSSDRTLEIAQSFNRAKVLSEPRVGSNQARQLGFASSSGELVANLDADNLISAAWLEKAFAEFEKNPKLVALSGPYAFYDLPTGLKFLTAVFFRLAWPFYVAGNRLFKKGGALMGGNLVFKRTALEQVGGYNTALQFYGDDTDTAKRLNKIGLLKFDYSFIVRSSGRRLKREGIIRAGFRYLINHLWVSMFGRAFHKKSL